MGVMKTLELKTGKRTPDLDAKGTDRADDLLGAVVPLRAREIPKSCEQSDLSNVIPFAPRARKGETKDAPREAPAINCAQEERPAPHVPFARQRWATALISGSILVHGAVFALFNREPEPHASIGVIAVNAELVLGADANAGQAETASESEVASAPSPETEKPDAPTPQAAAEPEVKPVEQPVEDPEEVKPEPPKPEEAVTENVKPEEVTPEPPKPEETAEVKPDVTEQPIPVEEKPEPVRENAELVADTKPAENPLLTATAQEPVALPKPRPDIKPEPKQVAKPDKPKAAKPEKEQAEKRRPERRAPSSVASTASNSVGRGRSSADSNYRGRVAAHLARYKRFPAEARRSGEQGTATITFSLSGSGGVTSVRLARGSGVPSIDREAQAMVRRASPFPAPPDGRRMSFTVPVSFHLR